MEAAETRATALRLAARVIDRINRDTDVQFRVLDASIDPPAPPETKTFFPAVSDWPVVVTVSLGVPVSEDPIGWARLVGGDRLDPVWSAHALADQIQDVVLEATCGQPLPACGGHRHPMRLVVHDSEIWWGCPAVDGQPGLRERLEL